MSRLFFGGSAGAGLFILVGVSNAIYYRYTPNSSEAARIQKRAARWFLCTGLVVLPICGVGLLIAALF